MSAPRRRARRNGARRATWVVLIALGSPLHAQLPPGTPLPAELASTWTIDRPEISSFYLTAPLGENAQTYLRAFVGFNAEEQAVWLSATYAEPALTDKAITKGEWHGTSFVPTAVCKRAGVARRFYVAGYIPRTGQVLVEEWRIDELSVAQYSGPVPPPGGGTPPVQLALNYDVRRQLVHLSDVHSPIVDMACSAASDQLLVLTSEPNKTLLRIDLTNGEAELAVERASIPDLGEYASLHMRVVGPGAEGGPYMAVYLRNTLRWRYSVEPGFGRGTHAEVVHLMRDHDFDGTFEAHEMTTFAALSADVDFVANLTALHDDAGALLD